MPNFGASAEEWDNFSRVLGLTSDLLPVVSNPGATISPQSTLKRLGKTPSLYNRRGAVVGVPGWTSYQATEGEVSLWGATPDYGICLQTRDVRAFDVDVPDRGVASMIYAHLAYLNLPKRMRADSGKFSLLFRASGELQHSEFTVDGGVIELLANGQQCVVAGTHEDGCRYEFLGGLPAEIPTLTLEEVASVWSTLAVLFSTGEVSRGQATVKKEKAVAATANDPTAQYLTENGWVLGAERDGRLHITCPFEDQHTGPSSVSSTTYFPAHTGGYINGHFRCLHAHCAGRNDSEYATAVGIEDALDFDDEGQIVAKIAKSRFSIEPIVEFSKGTPLAWIVRGLLPKAEVGMIFGAGNSGKTFFIFDVTCAIARGIPWRDARTKQGKCLYIVAEGVGGFRSRARAYAKANGMPLENLDVGIIGDSPNLVESGDVLALGSALDDFGDPTLIVVDTLAAATPGANENSGEDMSVVLTHCKGLSRRTGALVMLVHHSGKDAGRGARGWSGWLGGADCQIEVTADEVSGCKTATTTKQKDGGRGTVYKYTIPVVRVGIDEDGEHVDSCYVEVDDSPEEMPLDKEDIVLQVIERETLDGLSPTLNDVWESAAVLLPGGIKDARKTLTTLIKSGVVTEDQGRVSAS